MKFKAIFSACILFVLIFHIINSKFMLVQLFMMHLGFNTPQPLRAVGVLFSAMVSRWAGGPVGGHQEKVCPGCISETISCRRLILGRDIG